MTVLKEPWTQPPALYQDADTYSPRSLPGEIERTLSGANHDLGMHDIPVIPTFLINTMEQKLNVETQLQKFNCRANRWILVPRRAE